MKGKRQRLKRAAASGQRSALFQREMFDPSPGKEAPFDVVNLSLLVIKIFVPAVLATTQEFPIENRRWPPPFSRQIPKRQTLSLIVIIFVNDMIPPPFLSITKIKWNDVDQLHGPQQVLKAFYFLFDLVFRYPSNSVIFQHFVNQKAQAIYGKFKH